MNLAVCRESFRTRLTLESSGWKKWKGGLKALRVLRGIGMIRTVSRLGMVMRTRRGRCFVKLFEMVGFFASQSSPSSSIAKAECSFDVFVSLVIGFSTSGVPIPCPESTIVKTVSPRRPISQTSLAQHESFSMRNRPTFLTTPTQTW